MKPKQETFFSVGEMPERNWAYVVERRVVWDETTPSRIPDWLSYLGGGVSHFRSEAGALARMEELKGEHSRAVALKLIEFRVAPKYIGYVPDEDETWIKP